MNKISTTLRNLIWLNFRSTSNKGRFSKSLIIMELTRLSKKEMCPLRIDLRPPNRSWPPGTTKEENTQSPLTSQERREPRPITKTGSHQEVSKRYLSMILFLENKLYRRKVQRSWSRQSLRWSKHQTCWHTATEWSLEKEWTWCWIKIHIQAICQIINMTKISHHSFSTSNWNQSLMPKVPQTNKWAPTVRLQHQKLRILTYSRNLIRS